MLEVQQYLNAGNSLEQLYETYHLKITRHRKYPQIVLLKYDQLNSPMGEKIVQECRGLMLDESNSWKIVSYPFNKFFNYGEGHAASIDWTTAHVQEKLDGSLMSLYFYDGTWHVASSGSPDASGDVWMQGDSSSGERTFADLFWETFNSMGYEKPHVMFSNMTFMFEMMTQYNRIVVRYPKPRLVLIGVRDNRTCTEIHSRAFREMFEVVQEFSLVSIQDILKTFDKIDPFSQEGYVVVDSSFNRIKVKHPGYVAMHHMRDSFSPKRAVELIQLGESSEFLTYFPEYTDTFNAIRAKFDDLLIELDSTYASIKDIASQKDFAAEALKTRVPAALFSVRSGKVSSMSDFLKKCRAQNLMEIMDVK